MKKALSLFFLGFFLLSGCTSLNINKKNGKSLDRGEYSFIRGMNHYQRGNSDKAMEEYLKAYEKTPKNATLLKEIGLLYGEKNNVDKSILFFEKAYKINKKDMEIIKNLSYLYYLKKDYKNSQYYLEKVANMGSSHDIFILKMKGYIASSTGEIDKAYEYLAQVDEVDYDKNYFDEILKLYVSLNKKEELYEKLSKNYDNHSDKKDFILQYVYMEKNVFNNYIRATKNLLQHISIHGGDDDLYLALTELYMENGDYEKAKMAFLLVSKSKRHKKEYLDIKNLLDEKIVR